MYEDSPAFWHGELAKLRRGDRRNSPTLRLINRLADRDHVSFLNCTELVDRAAGRGDTDMLAAMRRAAAAQPPSGIRTLTLALIDNALSRLAHTAIETRHSRPRYRHYLEDRRTSGVVAVR